MKIVFYGNDGAAGKARATELRAGKVHVRLIHAEACRESEPCDEIEFMPDVSTSDRLRLSMLFGLSHGTTMPANARPEVSGLSVGRGPGGRWYIKDGKTIHSGPFASEAEASAALVKA